MQKNVIQKLGMFALVFLAFASVSIAQGEKPSPPKTAEGEINGSKITINYHSPSVKGRTIWGDLVPLGQVWRAGANDATTFESSKEIKIQGQILAPGKYSFFIIPGESESIMIFNKVAKQWGAYSYDESQDALRVKVPSILGTNFEEKLVYEVQPDGFEIRWEYAKTRAKIE